MVDKPTNPGEQADEAKGKQIKNQPGGGGGDGGRRAGSPPRLVNTQEVVLISTFLIVLTVFLLYNITIR